MSAHLKRLVPLPVLRVLSYCFTRLVSFREGVSFPFRLTSAGPTMVWNFRRLAHPFEFSTAKEEVNTVLQNVVRGECVGGPLPAKVSSFIDAGAYIGDTSAVYLSAFPDAVGLALEPGRAFARAVSNLSAYGPRITVLRAALMRTQGTCSVHEAGTGTHVTESGNVQSVDMELVLSMMPAGRVDLLKLDIEGAELELLRPPCGWLPRVGCIVVELHGPEAASQVPRWLRAAGFTMSRHRSLHFFNRADFS